MPDPVQTSVPTSAPAPSQPSAPAPVSTPSFQQPEGAMSADEIFRQFEQQLGMNEEQGPDFSKAKKWDDRTPEQILQDMESGLSSQESEETQAVDPTVGADVEQQTEITGEDASEFSYSFEDEVGGKTYKIDFKSPDQINTAIKKAIVADQLYKQNKSLQEQISGFKETQEYVQQIDNYLENDPKGLMDLIIEDLPEDEVKDWLISKAEWYGQDKEVRRQAQIQKENEILRRKFQAIEEREQRLVEERAKAAIEADRHVVQAWGASVMTKMKARIPESYHGIVERELRNAVLEANHMQKSNQEVNIKTLDKIFARNMRPILELISERTNPKTVNKEVAKVLQEKKQQNLARVQASASQAQSRVNTQTKLSKEIEDNPVKLFDHLMAGIESGRYRMKE